jgi:hypothetical protein
MSLVNNTYHVLKRSITVHALLRLHIRPRTAATREIILRQDILKRFIK